MLPLYCCNGVKLVGPDLDPNCLQRLSAGLIFMLLLLCADFFKINFFKKSFRII